MLDRVLNTTERFWKVLVQNQPESLYSFVSSIIHRQQPTNCLSVYFNCILWDAKKLPVLFFKKFGVRKKAIPFPNSIQKKVEQSKKFILEMSRWRLLCYGKETERFKELHFRRLLKTYVVYYQLKFLSRLFFVNKTHLNFIRAYYNPFLLWFKHINYILRERWNF